MNPQPLKEIPCGWGSSRTYYRKLFWGFFWIHSTSGRVEKEDLGFEANRIFSRLWWISHKTWEDQQKQYVGTCKCPTTKPPTP
jgi:hypothetical protein